MKVKLKTAEQLIEEFGFEYNGYRYKTKFNGMFWSINNSMLKYLGNEIEVKEFILSINYTHKGLYTEWYWHELWFEPNDFFKEDEFKI